MDGTILLKGLIFICLIASSTARELKVKDQGTIYNHTLATILVEYAATVYVSDLTELFTWTCPRCNDLTKGFQILDLIVDVKLCLQAFVGVAPDLNAIVVAFRGTQATSGFYFGQTMQGALMDNITPFTAPSYTWSIQNWIADLFWKQLDIKYPGMEDAMVHHGFYSAYHKTLRPGVLSAVKRAKELYGDIPIMVTGHSMGGAMAAFCGLDLTVNYGSRNVSVMTFGQPRIGNAAFASYYSKWVPNTIRVTHEHDIVPHLPPYYHYFPQKTYHHFPTEVWLHNPGFGLLVYTVEKVCDNSGEDPSCSRSVTGNSIKDHLWYYGVRLGGESPGFCRIVDHGLAAYGTVDVDGSVILSRDIPASVLRMNVGSNDKGRLG